MVLETFPNIWSAIIWKWEQNFPTAKDRSEANISFQNQRNSSAGFSNNFKLCQSEVVWLCGSSKASVPGTFPAEVKMPPARNWGGGKEYIPSSQTYSSLCDHLTSSPILKSSHQYLLLYHIPEEGEIIPGTRKHSKETWWLSCNGESYI